MSVDTSQSLAIMILSLAVMVLTLIMVFKK